MAKIFLTIITVWIVPRILFLNFSLPVIKSSIIITLWSIIVTSYVFIFIRFSPPPPLTFLHFSAQTHTHTHIFQHCIVIMVVFFYFLRSRLFRLVNSKRNRIKIPIPNVKCQEIPLQWHFVVNKNKYRDFVSSNNILKFIIYVEMGYLNGKLVRSQHFNFLSHLFTTRGWFFFGFSTKICNFSRPFVFIHFKFIIYYHIPLFVGISRITVCAHIHYYLKLITCCFTIMKMYGSHSVCECHTVHSR